MHHYNMYPMPLHRLRHFGRASETAVCLVTAMHRRGMRVYLDSRTLCEASILAVQIGKPPRTHCFIWPSLRFLAVRYGLCFRHTHTHTHTHTHREREREREYSAQHWAIQCFCVVYERNVQEPVNGQQFFFVRCRRDS